MQEEAVSALAALDADASFQSIVLGANAVPAVLAVLRSGSVNAQSAAAQATANIAGFSPEAQARVHVCMAIDVHGLVWAPSSTHLLAPTY